jgi:hypothetical protein
VRKIDSLLLLSCILVASAAIGQDGDPESRGAESAESRIAPGMYTDGTGMRFFQVLGGAIQIDYVPTTFAEAVESSSVIVKGYIADILQGRAIRSAAGSGSSP